VCEEGGVLPAEESNPGNEEESGGGGASPAENTEGGVLPAEESADTQPARQVAAQAETSQLPMTGFAAIPVLLGGLALLAGGLILRRRSA
jgi:LPXTG-motif cell wall-anchored protein